MTTSLSGLAFVAKPLSQLEPAERAAWTALVERHPENRRAFMSLPYAEAVAAVCPTVRVLVAYAAGQPAAFMPVQRRPDAAGRLGTWEPVGGVMTDYFGLVAAPGLQVDMAQGLRQSGLPLLAFTHLDSAQLQHGLRGEAPRIGLQTQIDEPVEAFWQRLRETDRKFV